jgi:hypothetical protein
METATYTDKTKEKTTEQLKKELQQVVIGDLSPLTKACNKLQKEINTLIERAEIKYGVTVVVRGSLDLIKYPDKSKNEKYLLVTFVKEVK